MDQSERGDPGARRQSHFKSEPLHLLCASLHVHRAMKCGSVTAGHMSRSLPPRKKSFHIVIKDPKTSYLNPFQKMPFSYSLRQQGWLGPIILFGFLKSITSVPCYLSST